MLYYSGNSSGQLFARAYRNFFFFTEETIRGMVYFFRNVKRECAKPCIFAGSKMKGNRDRMPRANTGEESSAGNGKGSTGAVRAERPPILETPASCGFPSPAEQYVESPLDLNELLVTRPAATYFVRAAGDSMLDAGIREGDILVVDRSLEAADGSVVIACVDGEFTVKYLRKDAEGLRLEPGNRKYRPIRFTEGMELRLFGVVTAVIHRFVTGGKPREVPCATKR